MALPATIYNFDVELADSDRGVYESIALRVARHPSESEEYLIARMLAYLIGLTYIAKSENLLSIESIWPVTLLAVPFVVGFRFEPVSIPIFIFFALWTLRGLNFIRRRQIRDCVTTLIAGI